MASLANPTSRLGAAAAGADSTRTPPASSASFRFEKQDYTAGSVLRTAALDDPDVRYAGLKVEAGGILLTVDCKGDTPPHRVLVRSVERARHSAQALSDAFQQATLAYKRGQEE